MKERLLSILAALVVLCAALPATLPAALVAAAAPAITADSDCQGGGVCTG